MYSKCEFYFLSIISVIFTLNCGAVYCLNQRGPTDQPSETYRHKRGSKFTIEELQNTQFATTISGDIDVDICKAVGFLGDIAIPNDQYDKEYLHQLKQEVIEGLQVEEEGLTDDIRIKLKQATSESSTQTSSHYNDPVDRSSSNLKSTKHGIGLNGYGKVYTNEDISKKEYSKQSNVDANNKQETKTNVYDDTNFDPVKKHGASDIRNIRNGSESNRTTVLNSNSSEINVKNDTIVAIFGEIKNKQKTLSENETSFETNEQQSRVATRQRNRNRNEMRTDRKKLTSVAHDEDVSEISSTTEADERRERRRHRRRRRRFRKRKSKHGTSQLSNSDTVAESQTSDRKQRKTRSVKYVTDSTLEPVTSNATQTNSYINPINNTFVRQNNITGSVPHETLSESVGHIPADSIVYKLLNRQSIVSDNETPVHEFERNFDYPRHKETKPVENEAVYHMQHNITAEEDAMLSLSGRQGRVTRAATARKERVWDHGVIPYEIDGNFSGAHKTLFKQAMRHWENYTCVKFVERVNEEHPNYILFTERPCGCCSFVGKRGNGAQAISIGKNCDKFGIVVHELGHVVGFWHEHTRPDRDHHVQIFREHIMSGQEYNFNKLTDEEVNSLGLPYDYDSIMHYARNTFSRGTYLDTIAPHEKQVRGRKPPEIGQRLRLSQGDIAQTNLLYKCPKCGRTFQDHTAIFSSPGYPEPAPAGTDGERCEWRITATLGEHIVLNITELDVHKSSDCATDYLEVRDGYWHRSPVLGRFCGSGRLPDPIVSTTSRMLVTYITSSRQTNHRGFIASYEAVCGGEYEVTTAGGHLESPNFPEDYFRNKECIWKLIVPETYTVALQFQAFEIENHDNCVYDYVEVIDGFEVDSPVIGKFCGYKPPPEIKSTSNTLLVKFFSDASVQKGGFSARFVQEHNECDQTDHGCEHYCINTLGSYECSCRMGYELHSDRKSCEVACGGIYDTPNGTITSPSFPDLYPGNKNCMWEIIAPPQYRITLNFTHFDLEGNHLYHQECEYDSVKVQSKLGTDIIRIHGTYCGTILPDMITSEGNALRVIFDSDLSVHKSGFAAVFFTDMDECAVDNGGCQHECTNTIGSYKCSCHNGFILHENEHDCKEGGCKFEITAPYGEIESPNYPDYYPSRKDCVWHFVTTPGHRIKLVFDKFEMEPHQECAYDHIVLYDGDSPESRTLGRFCGSKTPHPILATSNQMFMVFKSDASVQRKGFKAVHSTACGGHLQASDTVKHLYSHSKYGDYSYTNRAECDWSIEAGPGRSVHLTFLTFELEDETNCGYDFVEIYNGLDASGPSYGRFCGNQNPPDIISNNDALLVRFHSDDTIVSKGFSAAYVALDQFDDEIEDEAIQNNSELDENRF